MVQNRTAPRVNLPAGSSTIDGSSGTRRWSGWRNELRKSAPRIQIGGRIARHALGAGVDDLDEAFTFGGAGRKESTRGRHALAAAVIALGPPER
jgi:hypothetical protein